MEGSNPDFALHMEGSHANFAPHMEHKHSFRDQKLPFMPFSKYFFQTFYILEVYMTYLTIFEKKNSLRDSPLTTFLNDYMQPALVIFATLIQSLHEFGPTDEIQELFNARSYASVCSLMSSNYTVHE